VGGSGTAGGYLSTGTATYSTAGYAVASDPVNVHGLWGWLGRFAGEVRIRVTATSPGQPVFIAIGQAGDVSRYLAGVSYTSVTALGDHDVTQHPGTVVPAPPACDVVAPALIPKAAADRVKTDRRDCVRLALSHRAGMLTAIGSPASRRRRCGTWSAPGLTWSMTASG
jgi:hypothetical protein